MSLHSPVTMKMAFKPERFRKTFQVYFQRRVKNGRWMGYEVILPELFINLTAKTRRCKEYCREKNVVGTLEVFFGKLNLPVLQSSLLCAFAVMNYSGLSEVEGFL